MGSRTLYGEAKEYLGKSTYGNARRVNPMEIFSGRIQRYNSAK
jgi:hypothetical protein